MVGLGAGLSPVGTSFALVDPNDGALPSVPKVTRDIELSKEVIRTKLIGRAIYALDQRDYLVDWGAGSILAAWSSDPSHVAVGTEPKVQLAIVDRALSPADTLFSPMDNLLTKI